MQVAFEEGRFSLKTEFEERHRARAVGCRWNEEKHRWEVRANLLSAAQLLSQAKPGDDVEAARDFIQKWDRPVPTVASATKLPLMPHQVEGASRLLAHGRFLLTFDMGAGKSAAAIAVAQELWKAGKIDLVLIVVPQSIFGSWERQIEKFLAVSYRTVQLVGDRKKRLERFDDIETLRKSLVKKRLVFALINYEALRLFERELIRMKPGMVVFDESTAIKTRTAQMTKVASRISRVAKCVTALTGTPISNNVGDLFGQLHAVSSDFVGDDYWHFVQEFAVFGGWKGKEIIGARNQKGLDWLMKKVSLRVLKDDVLDLPDRTYERREVTLVGDQKEAYQKAEEEFYFAVAAVKKELTGMPDGSEDHEQRSLVTVLIKNALARLLRCQQIAAGHCKDESGEIILWPDNPKLLEIVRIAEESGDQRLVFFSRFVEDLEQGRRVLESEGFKSEIFCGGVKRQKRIEIESEFLKEQTALKAVLAQVRTGGFGIDFSKASVCAFVTNWFSWAVRDQAESRLHRLGQTRNVTIYDIVAQGTVDELILETVLSKKSLSETLFGRKVPLVDQAVEGFGTGIIPVEAEEERAFEELTGTVEKAMEVAKSLGYRPGKGREGRAG